MKLTAQVAIGMSGYTDLKAMNTKALHNPRCIY